MFTLICLPFIAVVLAAAYLFYARVVRPSPIALGSVIPKFRVVSGVEILEYCESNDTNHTYNRSKRKSRLEKLKIFSNYIAQMKWNTKLFLQLARFEQLKIDPTKSSLDYDSRETLILRLAEDAVTVRWLLIKAQIALLPHVFSGKEIKTYAVHTLLKMVGEYKVLEDNAVQLVGMATETCYLPMLSERLGLSN